MSRLARYVATTVTGAVLGVLLALLALDLLLAFLGEMDNLTATYRMKDVLVQVFLQAPASLYELIPIASLIGVLVGLGVLSGNSEITVMRAAGLSPLKIVGYTFIPALFFAASCLALAQWVVPSSESMAQARKAQALGDHALRGYWQREGEEFVHIAAVLGNGRLQGVAFYHYSPDGTLLDVSSASQAHFTLSGWNLGNWQESRIAADGSVDVQRDPSHLWDTSLTPQFLAMAAVEPDFQSPVQLYRYAHYLLGQGLDAAPYQLEFWKKIMQPVATLAMVLLAASIMFGPLRSVTMGLRLIAGVFLGLGYRYGQDFFGFASLIYHFSTFWGAALPAVMATVAGLVALLRVR